MAAFSSLYRLKLSTRCLTRLLKYFHWRVSLNGQSAPSRFQITRGWEELFKARLRGQEASRERDRKRNNERKQIRLTRCISFSLSHQSVLNERSVVSRPGQGLGHGSSLFPESLQLCHSRQGLDRFTSYAGISIGPGHYIQGNCANESGAQGKTAALSLAEKLTLAWTFY